MSDTRAAFYALRPGGWRDYVTLLHPPYTLWHLSYVAIGGTLVQREDWPVVGLTLAAFALALGIGAHALDELHDHPLETSISSPVLIGLAVSSIAGAAGIGIAVAVERTLWLLVFIAIGAFLVVAYNLELLGGRLHSDLWFALAWGAFPLLTGSFAVAKSIRVDAAVGAASALLLSLAQRTLSRRVRDMRRRAVHVVGTVEYADGTSEAIDAAALTEMPERALQLLTGAVVGLAVALVLHRLL